jgi:hypothetical protein
MSRRSSVLGLLLLAAGCGPVESFPGTPAPAPILAKADGGDRADRACQGVLRQASRTPDGRGGFVTAGGHWVWTAWVDVRQALVDDGATAAVLYQPAAGQGWLSYPGVPVEGAPAGWQRFRVELAEGTAPQPGWSGTAIARARAELAPYVLLSDGGRLFDHNRHSPDFANYVLDAGNQFAVAEDASVCPATPPRAELELLAGWREVQHGPIVPGGTLTVRYDLARLPACRLSRAGYQLWDVEAYVRFQPEGHVAYASLTRVESGGRVSVPTSFEVPPGTQAVELWFRNANGDRSCETWDSKFGQNYRFAATRLPAPIGWAGSWGGSWSRACTHADGLAEPLIFDSYTRERACTFIDAEVWQPGVTDGATPHPEWLHAEVEYTIDGGAAQRAWLQPVGRVGNNQRFRWELPYELRRPDLLAWQRLEYAFRFSHDGNAFYRIAAADGPGGGAARTVLHAP